MRPWDTPPGEYVALMAIRDSMTLDAGANNPDIASRVGTFVLWAVALDERLAKLNPRVYKQERQRHPDGKLLPALTFARNVIAHGSVPCASVPGLTIPFTVPVSIPPSVWQAVEQLLSEFPEIRRTRAFQQGVDDYRIFLEGNIVNAFMLPVQAWFEQGNRYFAQGTSPWDDD